MRIHSYLLFFFAFHLTACSKNQSCTVVTLEIQPSAIKCLFYPDTQICTHGLQGRSCWVLLKEPATYIYRRQGKSRLRLWRKEFSCGGLCTVLLNGCDEILGRHKAVWMHKILALSSGIEAGIIKEVWSVKEQNVKNKQTNKKPARKVQLLPLHLQ